MVLLYEIKIFFFLTGKFLGMPESVCLWKNRDGICKARSVGSLVHCRGGLPQESSKRGGFCRWEERSWNSSQRWRICFQLAGAWILRDIPGIIYSSPQSSPALTAVSVAYHPWMSSCFSEETCILLRKTEATNLTVLVPMKQRSFIQMSWDFYC